MKFKKIIETTKAHYSQKVKDHGTGFKGVDWGSDDGQKIRFEQLLKFVDLDQNISLLDYGCGYGAIVDLLVQQQFKGTYQGYDISEQMILEAVSKYSDEKDVEFTSDSSKLKKADYTLSSGIFNVKLETSDDAWEPYIYKTIEELSDRSRLGFVFNMLSSYTPVESREWDLYYADPRTIFDFCMKKFSGGVSLSHDYMPSDFTVSVKFSL